MDPGKKALTDEQIRDLMENDPAAAQFLKGMVPDDGEKNPHFEA